MVERWPHAPENGRFDSTSCDHGPHASKDKPETLVRREGSDSSLGDTHGQQEQDSRMATEHKTTSAELWSHGANLQQREGGPTPAGIFKEAM